MASKMPAPSSAPKDIKISVLAEELGVDAREVTAAAKEMAMENAKVPASWVTGGQAERLRAKFGGHKGLKEIAERRQRAAEINAGNMPPPEPAAPVAPPQPVLRKKQYEGDRRAIFGVVTTAGGAPVEKPPVETHKPARHAPAAASSEPVKHNLLVPVPEAKKFIGIQVPEPVRRASSPVVEDSRFGVVAAAPAPEKPAENAAILPPTADLWGKLNDGRPSIDLTQTPAEKSAPEPEPETLQPIEEIATVEEIIEVPIEVKAVIPPAPVAEEVDDDDDDGEPIQLTPMAPRLHEVPRTIQPKHRAFGTKHKLKHKKHKLVEKKKAEKHKAAAHAPKHAKQAEHKAPEKHAHPAKHHKPAHEPKKEGLLRRIARKFLGK